MTQRPTIGLALLVLGMGLPLPSAAVDVPVGFNSKPPGAVVCSRAGKRETCHGKTPLSLNLSFNSSNESKRFELHKLGYRSAEALVTPTSGDIKVDLSRQSLFVDPSAHKSEPLRQLQKQINVSVGKALYGYQGPVDQKIQPTGKFVLIKTKDGEKRLKFSILINSQQVLKDLKKASRTRNEAKRAGKVVSVMKENGVFAYFDLISGAIASLPVESVEFNVNYSQSKAVLDFDQVQSLESRWTGSYYTGYGNVRQRVDTYEMYTVTQDITVVKDSKLTVEYTFLAAREALQAAALSGLAKSLDQFVILSDDNRKQKVTRVDPVSLDR